jgi:hypothetical protein
LEISVALLLSIVNSAPAARPHREKIVESIKVHNAMTRLDSGSFGTRQIIF